MSGWTDFVTKIYNEEHSKNPNYQYKQAMKDASKRKGEMGSSSSSAKTSKKQRKTKKHGGSKKLKKSKKSRKNRK